ncbi:transposase, partial [Streptomyces tauricus]|uniref:transposase n=1 Tax=Streptomyces tauricus TaxID=68274 RepID=UPI001BC99626
MTGLALRGAQGIWRPIWTETPPGKGSYACLHGRVSVRRLAIARPGPRWRSHGATHAGCGPATRITLEFAARSFRLDQSVVGPGVPLTDAQWARIEPLLPDRTPKRGGRWRDHREVIDAIAFKFQTGTQWVHLPEKYGSWRG